MSKLVASNTFTEGLMKDTNPLTTPNTVLTDCLNGTTITYNGKEFVLQNDMGNAIVETASLKRGYIPIGLKEYGGIIYVVSYNPLENRVEFGSFPSPERDFTGDDFDTNDFTGFSVEGCRLTTSDFYDPNFKHPTLLALLQQELGEINSQSDTYTINQTVEESLSPTILLLSSITTIPYFNDVVVYHDANPSGLGIEDYWTINTLGSQPMYHLIKNYVVDDFSAYEGLKLNTGDRFVIYHIDMSASIDPDYNDIVDTIIKLYVSDETTRKLFKIEVYAVTDSGRQKLDINPLLLKQSDLVPVSGNTSYLSGDLTEQINYNIYNFDNGGIIEIRIVLERPEYFNVHFRQYPNTTPSVKFITKLTNTSFMQIKGFRYIFKYLNEESQIAAGSGSMYYTLGTLYKPTGAYYVKNNTENSVVLLDNLSVGTYSYEILPYTQYGYEYNLLKKGTFDVAENLTTTESTIDVDEFYWVYHPATIPTFDLHLNTTLSITPDQTITDVYAELYDVWSNCSVYIDLTSYQDPLDPSVVLYDETFTLNGPQRAKGNYFPTDSSQGSIHGFPYDDLTTSSKLKLPNPTVNYLNRIQVVDPVSGNRLLRKNHFYVLAIYYSYTDTVLNQDFQTGVFRYVYTNDQFTSYLGNTVNFSQTVYPNQNISLSLVLSTPQDDLITTTKILNPTLDESTLLFDPNLQTYNTTTNEPDLKNLTGYAIGPDSFYKKYTTDKSVHIDSISRNNFLIKRYYDYVVNGNSLVDLQTNLPGDLNIEILSLDNGEGLIINPDNSNRTLIYGSEGAIDDPENHIFGDTQNLIYSINFTKGTNRLILSLNSLYFNIESNKIFPYVSETFYEAKGTGNEVRLLFPLFFQASEEIVNQILYGYQQNQTEYLPGATYLNESKIYHQNLIIQHYAPNDNHPASPTLYNWWNEYFFGNTTTGNGQVVTLSEKITKQKITDPEFQHNGLLTRHYCADVYKNLYNYEILESSCFWNANSVLYESDLHRNVVIYTPPSHITTTKLQNDPEIYQRTLAKLSMWKAKQLRAVANSGEDIIKVYTLVKSYHDIGVLPSYGTQECFDCFETSTDFQLLNLFLFFGAYTENNDGYYNMYYVKDTKFACESEDSYVNYQDSVTFHPNIIQDYCFKIMFGAQNKMIVLREDDDEQNILTYIYSRFNFNSDGSNPEMFPMATADNIDNTFSFSIDVHPAMGLLQETDTKITEAYTAVTTTHTIYNPILKNTLGFKHVIDRTGTSQLLSGGYVNTDFNNAELLYLIDPTGVRPFAIGTILALLEPTVLIGLRYGNIVNYYYTKFNSEQNVIHPLFGANNITP